MTEQTQFSLRASSEDSLLFVPLGGTGEIGMNLNAYGCQGKWIAVDMGVSFGDDSVPGVDVVMPDPIFLEEQGDDLLGIVITHAHEDHIGAVAYLWPDLRCPVYATPFAAQFLRFKLKEEGIEDDVEIHEIPVGGRVSIGPFDIEFVALTHSIPEPSSLMIRTPFGNVYHSGDWKFDADPLISDPVNRDYLRALGDEGILACVADSTNILSRKASGSEGDARRGLFEEIAKYGGKVAVACFASNIARLESIVLAARHNGRQVCLVGRSLWRLVETARETGFLRDIGPLLEAEDAADLPDHKVLYLCTGSQGEPRAALMRIAYGNHPFVKLGAGDVAIFSSRVIPGNEKAVFRLQNQLVRSGVEIVTDHEAPIHVSGHPGQPEVGELYGLLRPTMVVPVHGEARHLRAHADFALNLGISHAEIVGDGDIVRLAPKGPEVIGEAPIGRLTLDGDRIVPLDSPALKERKKMILNGVASVTLVLSGQGKLLADPVVSARGLISPDDDEDGAGTIAELVREAVEGLDAKARRDDDIVREEARRAVRRAFQMDQGRKPLTDVHLVRV